MYTLVQYYTPMFGVPRQQCKQNKLLRIYHTPRVRPDVHVSDQMWRCVIPLHSTKPSTTLAIKRKTHEKFTFNLKKNNHARKPHFT